MDNSLTELEAELKRLRPVTPSASLASRIASRMEEPAERRFSWAWVALPLAAAIALGIYINGHVTTPAGESSPADSRVATAAMTPTYKPVSAQNILYDQRDEGLVTLADGSTARRIRNSYVDTITWKDSRSQASLKWSVPRTEERVVPVTFQ
jgi:hypothetical protein